MFAAFAVCSPAAANPIALTKKILRPCPDLLRIIMFAL
jgi:hypothetical protein